MNNDIVPDSMFPRAERRTSTVFLDACADARNATSDVLTAGIELFELSTRDPDASDVERHLASERLAAFEQELDRRDRVSRLTPGQASRSAREHRAWTALARAVRERVEVPGILVMAGVPMTRTGTSRGREEWHGACPICATGKDRLVAWAGPNGRVWCRRCRWSGDVVAVVSLIVGPDFRASVAYLAELAGLGVPDGR